jgi:hypothetical protein
MIAEPGKPRTRCSRFTIKLPDGQRDVYCVAHSKAAHAEVLRGKGLKAQRLAEQAERQRLEELSAELLPRVWATKSQFQDSRAQLYWAVVRGDVTVPQASVLRQIIADAEKHATLKLYDWGPGFGENAGR